MGSVMMNIRTQEIPCNACGVLFWITGEFCDARKRDGKTFYCPNGHTLSYDGDYDRLRRERDRLKQENARLEEEKAYGERMMKEALAESKRLKRRAASGTCPECKRTFPELARHIAHRHPGMVEEARTKRGRKSNAQLLIEGPKH